MGINGLPAYLKKWLPLSAKMSQFAGASVGIDVSIVMHKAIYAANKIATSSLTISNFLRDEDSFRRHYLLKLVESALTWVKCRITPIYVFDGLDTPNKVVLQTRAEKNAQSDALLNSYIQKLSVPLHQRNPDDFAAYRQLMQNMTRVTEEIHFLTIECFRQLGFQLIFAKGEADKVLASLYKEGKINLVFSPDSDILTHGVGLVCTAITESPARIRGQFDYEMSLVSLDQALAQMQISYASFIDACIYAGCDYNYGYPRVAFATALKRIRECERIENLNHDVSSLRYDIARQEFSYIESSQLIAQEILPMPPSVDVNFFNNDKLLSRVHFLLFLKGSNLQWTTSSTS